MKLFPPPLTAKAKIVLAKARARDATIAAAESCTGGLLAGCLTEIPGSSDVFTRGFVTYANAAKVEMLGVAPALIDAHGAVSEAVARAMAEGGLNRSAAAFCMAITGVAGPSGGGEKPVGLVHFALAMPGLTTHETRRFGDIGRTTVRLASVETALDMLLAAMD